MRGTEYEAATDAELVAAVAGGDPQALRAVYLRHVGWLAARLQRRCSDRAVVDEVVQDTFVAVWRGAKRYDGRGEVAAWIWGIGIRRLVDRFRRKRLPDWRLERSVPEPSAEEQVLIGIEHGGLGQAIDRLSPELRAVIRATVLDGLTAAEAGVLLGIPVGTVKTRLMRARHQLREALA